MSAAAEHPRERGALRTLGMLAATVLGGTAVFIVVVGHTQKQVQVGLLVGLWGALLGAFTLFGPRRGGVEPGHEAAGPGSERVPAQRREDELQLEVMVRREMERVLREELSQLRGEVAGLRNDLTEKVNGQLRLERIETTRVISSDIEELQHDFRRLALSRAPAGALDAAPAFSPATVVESRVKHSAPLPYVYANSSSRPRPAPPRPLREPARPEAPGADAAADSPAARPQPPPADPTPRQAPTPAGPPGEGRPAAAANPTGPGGSASEPSACEAAAWPVPAAARAVPSPVFPAASPGPTAGPPGGPALFSPRPAAPAPPSPLTPPAPAAGGIPPEHSTSVLPRPPLADAPPAGGPAPTRPASGPTMPAAPPPRPGFGPPEPPRPGFGPPEPPRPGFGPPEPPRPGFGPPEPPRPGFGPPEPPRSIPSLDALRAQLAESMAASRPPTPARPESADPLGGLPRLSRFDYDWDEPSERRLPTPSNIDPPETQGRATSRPVVASQPPPPSAPEPPSRPPTPTPYVGRRRSSGDSAPRYPAPADGSSANGSTPQDARSPGTPYDSGSNATNGIDSHGANGIDSHGVHGTESHAANGTYGNAARANGTNGAHANGTNGARPGGGGHRRRSDGDVDEVLARLLGR
jgi:hypothetical protein